MGRPYDHRLFSLDEIRDQSRKRISVPCKSCGKRHRQTENAFWEKMHSKKKDDLKCQHCGMTSQNYYWKNRLRGDLIDMVEDMNTFAKGWGATIRIANVDITWER